MALSNKWWILCAFVLYFVTRFGSCRRHREDGTPPRPFIFNELCALKAETGPCRANRERFFFNVDTGHCEVFAYGGCWGNGNNFLTLEACEEMCVVSDEKNPCHLPEAPGPCRALATRYFFDTESQQCKHFYYGGCFGNANNFQSMTECRAKCQNPVKPTKAPEVQTQPARTVFDMQPTIRTWEIGASEPLVQVNETNQEVQDLKPIDPCSRPLAKGTCDGAEKRFAYNPKTRRCHMFRYSGCGGNENNFKHRKDCRIKCGQRKKALEMRMIRIKKKNLNNIVHRSV